MVTKLKDNLIDFPSKAGGSIDYSKLKGASDNDIVDILTILLQRVADLEKAVEALKLKDTAK